jgi:hypothetical protein
MTDVKGLAECKEIGGVEVTESIKYLGMTLFCDRQKTLRAAKSKMKKYMIYLKRKIFS